jgi:tetratricopeptide (TPR) repeat protein/transglutaminase-like putative cysteine protease
MRRLALLPLGVAALIISSASFGPRAASADTLTLRDGKHVTGKIVSESATELLVETAEGKKTVARASVLLIVRDPGEMAPTPALPPAGGGGVAALPDGLPAATALEKEGLALEGKGRFAEAMAKFEASLASVVGADAKVGDERAARAEFLIRRLAFFWTKLSEHERGAKNLGALAENASLGPYTRDMARWFLVGQLRSLGKNDEADAAVAKLGFGTAWYVMGSFDNERGTGFATAWGPEESAFDPKASFTGKKRKVFWRPVPLAHPHFGEVDLDAMLRPNDQCLAYAISYLHADEATKVALRLGSDEALKVWVNGTLVDAEDKRRPLKFDQTHVGVALHAGWNEVLLKVCDQTGPWGFRCRVTAPEGGAAKGVRWAALDEIATTETFEKGCETFAASRGAIDWLEARRKADPKDAASRFRLGYIYYSDKPHDENEHLDREAMEEAIAIAPNDPAYRVFYSHTAAVNAEFSVNREENKRRQALEKALELDPGHAQAAWLLATYYESSLANHSKARALAEQALKANPGFLDAELLVLSLDERRGLQPIVARRLRELAATDAGHTYAALVRKLVREDAARGDLVAQGARLETLAALDRSDAVPLMEEAGIASRQGKLDVAAKLLAQASALAPWDLGVRASLAATQEAASDLAGAEASLRAALEISPEDEAMLQRLGHLVERAGRQAEARKVFDHALEINPTLVELKKYLEWLDRKAEGAVAPFENDWTLDAATVVEAAKATPVDSSLVSRVLLRNTVVKVNVDGTSQTFTQEIERVENDEGVKELASKTIGYHAGEQKATFKRARVYRKNGDIDDSPVSESSSGGGGGEFASYVGHSVSFETLEVGDIIETQSRIDDLTQSFFGDYFGTDERFGEFNKPIDRLRFVVIAPKERKLYVHTTGLDDVKMVEKADDKKMVTARIWEKLAIAKIEPEPHMPWAQEVLPKVQVSTIEDWNAFAKWYWGLVKKQQESDDSIRTKVAELTKDCKTDEEKIRKIYNFVVTDIRYNAAWEFGVHGFKPYNATSIFARKFGDCKDKATLINTMLAEVKIKSYPVLIMGENPRGKEDLALPLMHHFNHCISYVPGAKGGKGMWLDGTAEFHPFDTLPTMDYGATTLIIFPDHGELKTIPFRGPEANQETESHRVTVKGDGSATVHSIFGGSGDFNWYFRKALETKGRRQEVLEQSIGKHYSGAKVTKVTTSDLENLDEKVRVEVEVALPKVFQKSTGGYAVEEMRSWLFDQLYLHGQKISNFAAKEARDFDVVLEVPSGVEEETVYELPAGMDVKSQPKDTKIDNEFATYTKTYTLEKGKLHAIRKLELKTNRIPREKYDEFRKMLGEIERSENDRVILSKEGGEE